MCAEWVKRGYEVTVLTGYPNYPQGEYYEGYGRSKHLSVAPNPKRESFMRDVQSKDYEKTAIKYTRPSLYRRARTLAGRIKRESLSVFG